MRNLLAAILLLPAAAFAGAYAIPNEAPRDLALAQSDVAAQVGPEAAKQNMSALAGQQGLAVTASDEWLYNITSWSDPTLGGAKLRRKFNWPPEIAAAWGDKLSNGMPYGAGIAFLVPGGGSLFWPAGWPGASRIQTVDQKVYLLQAGGAIQPLPWAKFGASVLYYRVVEELTQQLNFIGSTGIAKLGLTGNVFTYGLSGEFRPPPLPNLTIGVDYRHQAPVTLSGSAHFDNVPPTFASALQDQGATESVTVPNDLYVGAAYDVSSQLKLMGSWNLERWKVYRSDTYVGAKGLVISVPRNYNNAYVFRFGAEYAQVPFAPALTLRAGFLRSISNQNPDYVSPTLTDANSWAGTVGAGYEFIPGLRGDIGYEFAQFDRVTATGVEAFPGSYDTHVHLLSAGFTFRMK